MFPPQVIEQLRKAQRIAVLTGAGISAESGIPTFRDALTGLWENFKPEELATVEAFKRQPKLVWDWYAMRRAMVHEVEPNPGHVALARMAEHVPHFTLATQNIDSLHQRAGSQQVLELHGNISRVKCLAGHGVVAEADWVADAEGGVPRCPDCHGLLRPDVVWFGEYLPLAALEQAQKAFRQADVIFSIGTSGMVPPAAHLPLLGLENGAFTIEINPDETQLTPYLECCIRGPSGLVLPQLVEAVWSTQ